MHLCKLSDIFTPEELDFLAETLEGALDEATETLEAHETDRSITGDLSAAFEQYIDNIRTQKARIRALQRAQRLVEDSRKHE